MTNVETPVAQDKAFLSQRVYNALKYFSLIILPALTTAYFTIGTLWEWNDIEKIMGTMVALNTTLGVILGISTSRYNKSDAKFDGLVNISYNDDGVKVYSLELNTHPDDLDEMKEVVFKVSPSDDPQ